MSGSTAIADHFRSTGAKRLVYCHCDHFEPWRSKPSTIGPENAALVEQFASQTRQIEEARRLTLFYRPHCRPVLVPRDGAQSLPDDRFGFLPLDEEALAITAPAIRSLVEAGLELQLHVHHERVTTNSRYALTTPWADSLARPGAAARDGDRLRLLLRLSLDTLRAESGLPLDRWLFVHGNWALAASDPEVCQVADELAILKELGCAGDFTFAGEPRHDHCNPAVEVPSLIRAASGPKAYDLADADPQPAFGAGAEAARDRLFLWSSPRGRIAFALDYTNWQVEARTREPLAWARELAGRSMQFGDTLYLMTYAHSMSAKHGELGSIVFPHAHPSIRRMFGTLFEAASAAGLDIAFLTAGEVMDEVLAGAATAERADLDGGRQLPTG